MRRAKTDKIELKFINYKCYLITIISLILSLVIFNILYRNSTVFATTYSNNIYPYFVRTIGFVCSAIPFSVFELMIASLVCLLIFCIVRLVVLLCKYHSKSNRFYFLYHLKKYLLNLVCIVLIFLMVYSLTCGVNYYRIPFSTTADIVIRERSTEELKSLCKILIEDVNEYSTEIQTTKDGIFTADNISLLKAAAIAMEELSIKYPCLSDYYPNAKAIICSPFMSYQNITGIYSPFTIEANYNDDVTDMEKPFTICHELSHLSGYMREDEANFIAYLGCMESDSIEFKYSGSIMALIYVSNQVYYNCTDEEYNELMETLCEQAHRDLAYQSEYWQTYEEKIEEIAIGDTTISDISSEINNTYLEVNGQVDGVHSYDRVTDLLLSYYEDELH